MKRWCGLFFILLFMVSPLPVLANEYTLSAGSLFTRYSSDENDEGTQVCVPVSLSAQLNDWSFDFGTSFRHSQAENSSDQDETLSGASDTTTRIAYHKPGLLPFDVLFALDLNLPTGKSDITREEAGLFSDTDLFPFKAFGEGLNINPSIILANTWGKWKAGFGVGYTFRGEYDHSSDLKKYDPGDIFLMTGEAGVEISDALEAGLYFEYGFFGKDKQNGSDYYQEGDFLVSGGNIVMKKTKWDLLLNLEMILRTGWVNDDELIALKSNGLVSTTDQNMGDEIKAKLAYRRLLTDRSSARGVLEIARLDKNDRAETDPLYFGKRNKIRSGVSFAHAFSPVTQGEIGIDMFFLDADKSYLNTTDTTYKGVTLAVNVTRIF